MRREPRTAVGSACDPALLRPRRKKALGQHHLRSGAICRPLVDFLAPAGRSVVEVGPGGGVLTAELLDAGAHVLALELDPEWATELGKRLSRPELEVRVADALEFDWSALPVGTLVAGNLPYNVGTAIVERVLGAGAAIPRAAFLLQREVVDRMTAVPGDPAFGALSLRVALRAAAVRLGTVKPGAFRPPPKVDSAFVGLTLRPSPPPLAGREDAFEAYLHEAFATRRKTLANGLARRRDRERIATALDAVGLASSVRAEELDLATHARLFERLEPAG